MSTLEIYRDQKKLKPRQIQKLTRDVETAKLNLDEKIDGNAFLDGLERLRERDRFDLEFSTLKEITDFVSFHNDYAHKDSVFGNITKTTPLSRETILEICKRIPSARDKIAILGPYEGLGGTGLQELVDLKIEDVKDDYVLIPTRDQERKFFYPSKELMQYLREAIEETTYTNIVPSGIGKTVNLIEDGHVFKRIEKEKTTKANNKRQMWLLARKISSYLGFKDNISGTQIINSGRAHYLMEIAKENGLSLKDYLLNTNHSEYKNRFDIPANLWAKRIYRSVMDWLPADDPEVQEVDKLFGYVYVGDEDDDDY